MTTGGLHSNHQEFPLFFPQRSATSLQGKLTVQPMTGRRIIHQNSSASFLPTLTDSVRVSNVRTPTAVAHTSSRQGRQKIGESVTNVPQTCKREPTYSSDRVSDRASISPVRNGWGRGSVSFGPLMSITHSATAVDFSASRKSTAAHGFIFGQPVGVTLSHKGGKTPATTRGTR
jgi:hypothetical protein